jgi:sulfate transport system ATP-binding protein
MTFLGTVNIFHGRVESGRAMLGPMELEYPEHTGAPAKAAGYARPYELEVSRRDDGDGWWATLQEISAAGATARLELSDDDRSPLKVEIGRDTYDALRPRTGERLYVKPRRVRVFLAAP